MAPALAHLGILEEWSECCDELTSVLRRLQQIGERDAVARLLAGYVAQFLVENGLGASAFVDDVRTDMRSHPGVIE